MFPCRGSPRPGRRCLPRARGGVPASSTSRTLSKKSSPRTRGCSPAGCRAGTQRAVFPAHAGVFPKQQRSTRAPQRLPRARGGVPRQVVVPADDDASSPRTRGCSRSQHQPTATETVFPAHAGVFPPARPRSTGTSGLPRARGGVPAKNATDSSTSPSSPRTRGCSRSAAAAASRAIVFPAHAGVFPWGRHLPRQRRRLPRARGGVPVCGRTGSNGHVSSPRTRGCSPPKGYDRQPNTVFPAHAGVFPPRSLRVLCWMRLPRARGGVPCG